MPNRKKNKTTDPEALTSIGKPIHCAATEEPGPDGDSREELDELEINNFIKILAEVAIALATRRLNGKDSGS